MVTIPSIFKILLNFPLPFKPSLVDSPVASQVVKDLPANAGGLKDVDLIPGLGRSPEEGNAKPLQYSRLGNPMDRGAWWATVHGVAGSD